MTTNAKSRVFATPPCADDGDPYFCPDDAALLLESRVHKSRIAAADAPRFRIVRGRVKAMPAVALPKRPQA